MLAIEKLTVRYIHGTEPVLAGVTLNVGAGERVALVGPAAAAKQRS